MNADTVTDTDTEILIPRKAGIPDSARTSRDVFERPLTSENVKKLEARGTGVKAIRDGIGRFPGLKKEKESRIEEIGVIRRVID